MYLLSHLLRRFVRTGTLRVIDPSGKLPARTAVCTVPSFANSLAIRLRSPGGPPFESTAFTVTPSDSPLARTGAPVAATEMM